MVCVCLPTFKVNELHPIKKYVYILRFFFPPVVLLPPLYSAVGRRGGILATLGTLIRPIGGCVDLGECEVTAADIVSWSAVSRLYGPISGTEAPRNDRKGAVAGRSAEI